MKVKKNLVLKNLRSACKHTINRNRGPTEEALSSSIYSETSSSFNYSCFWSWLDRNWLCGSPLTSRTQFFRISFHQSNSLFYFPEIMNCDDDDDDYKKNQRERGEKQGNGPTCNTSPTLTQKAVGSGETGNQTPLFKEICRPPTSLDLKRVKIWGSECSPKPTLLVLVL